LSYRAPLFRWLRHWHARIGLVAALFFLFLVVSGIALNHTDALKLDQRHIGAAWLTRWYGLRADVPTHGFKLGEQYLTSDAQQWVLDRRIIATREPQPIGAVRIGEVCYVATHDALFLYAPDGKLIDKVTGEALPALPLAHLTLEGERVVVGTAQGSFASSDATGWAPLKVAPPWSQVVALPASLGSALGAIYAPTIDSERLLLDLHSGRIFGRYGPLLIDAAALALLALAISGVWMYVRAARVQRHRDRR
jgi:uncharacterized iron-regulated membrane protein